MFRTKRTTSDVLFTPAVKAEQARDGSRRNYARMEARGGFTAGITPELVAFLAEVDTSFLASANSAGQPYVQHRGGPKGFIRVVDDTTLGFTDYGGNRQFVTTGNFAENDRAFLILMDYARCRRIKVWGQGRVVQDEPGLMARLMPPSYAARAHQVVLFQVEGYDVNCSAHIPQKVNVSELGDVYATLQQRMTVLEAENLRLRAELASRLPIPRRPWRAWRESSF